MTRCVRVLIFSAAIGEGHDLPARMIAADLRELGAEAVIVDGLEVLGWPIGSALMSGTTIHTRLGRVLYDVEYWLITRVRTAQRLGNALAYALGGRRILRTIAALRTDVVISTYPGLTEALGELRRRGKLDLPLASAITDLAALRYWAHPDVDLHLVTHPESVDEVRELAPRSQIVPARGMNSPEFVEPRDRLEARRALGLPEEPKLVVVSGGGWAIGDLEGAVRAGLEQPGAMVVALCGRNAKVRAALERDFAGDPRVRVWGFTERMGDLLAAADALVHSTAGLTVLEAHVRGCPTISYGWGRAHIRANNEAFTRFGLAEVAATRRQLGPALARALERRQAPDTSFARLPSAAAVVLERLAGARGQHPGGARHYAEQDGDQPAAEGGGAPVLAGDERGEQHRDAYLEHHDQRADAGGR